MKKVIDTRFLISPDFKCKMEKFLFYINLTSLRFCILHAVGMMISVKTKCKKHRDHDLTESSKSPASIAKSNKQLFGYEQVAKRIANIRLAKKITKIPCEKRRKNIMKRKVIAITLTAMMAAGMLAGCGSSDSSSSSAADTTKEASATEAAGSTDGDSTAAAGDFSGQISVISREDGSGTRGAFIELFGVEEKNDAGEKVDNTTVDAQITNNTSVMMSTVAGNQYAIGYISLGSLNDEVKALKIDGAEASAENVENGSYKVSRPFNIVTKDGLSADAQDFMDYILSTDGQQVVSDDGYIAIKDTKAYEGSCGGEKVVVAGSSSVTPLMEKLKEAYTKVNSNANIEVQQSDSTTGITSASDGLCDIGMASRDLKDEEKSSGLTATVIATDGIAVIVNKENPTDGLTSDQVKSIYVGDTTDWADVK